jgi:hypothetical protein
VSLLRALNKDIETRRDYISPFQQQYFIARITKENNKTMIQTDRIKVDEMGGACSMLGRDEECIQYFGWKT